MLDKLKQSVLVEIIKRNTKVAEKLILLVEDARKNTVDSPSSLVDKHLPDILSAASQLPLLGGVLKEAFTVATEKRAKE